MLEDKSLLESIPVCEGKFNNNTIVGRLSNYCIYYIEESKKKYKDLYEDCEKSTGNKSSLWYGSIYEEKTIGEMIHPDGSKYSNYPLLWGNKVQVYERKTRPKITSDRSYKEEKKNYEVEFYLSSFENARVLLKKISSEDLIKVFENINATCDHTAASSLAKMFDLELDTKTSNRIIYEEALEAVRSLGTKDRKESYSTFNVHIFKLKSTLPSLPKYGIRDQKNIYGPMFNFYDYLVSNNLFSTLSLGDRKIIYQYYMVAKYQSFSKQYQIAQRYINFAQSSPENLKEQREIFRWLRTLESENVENYNFYFNTQEQEMIEQIASALEKNNTYSSASTQRVERETYQQPVQTQNTSGLSLEQFAARRAKYTKSGDVAKTFIANVRSYSSIDESLNEFMALFIEKLFDRLCAEGTIAEVDQETINMYMNQFGESRHR